MCLYLSVLQGFLMSGSRQPENVSSSAKQIAVRDWGRADSPIRCRPKRCKLLLRSDFAAAAIGAQGRRGGHLLSMR
jgi:hypothetical protein